ncbi:MAG TPA: ABC transporter substrate-binding protein [Methanosarcinales archaeon]|nr:ABC transporter substrate-binding protein [Methanosarcinales archaeon]
MKLTRNKPNKRIISRTKEVIDVNVVIRFGMIGIIVSTMLLASLPSASATLYGDANEDTRINMQDVTKVERMILEYDPETTSADTNQDDDINMQDVTYIELIILERKPFPGGSLNAVMIFGPKDNTLDPAYKWTGWYMRKAGIYETLFKYNAEMELTPELATGYTQVSDTVWDIHLREGVTFHDGTPFNADAVVYSIGRVTDESNSRSSEYDHIASVVAQDDYTVRITTTDPYAPTIASLTDPLVSMVSPDASDLATDPVGTGPFMYDSNEFGASLSVVRNPDYWGGGVKLEDATLTYVRDSTTRATMLESGDVDMARGLPYPQVSTIEGDPDLDVVGKETMRVYFMFVNTEKAPLDDVRVRQAINYAIDRDEVVDVALEGVGGVSAKGVFPSIFPWANDELAGYSHNQATALALLEDAGITDIDGDGTLEYDGADFTLNIKTYTSRAAMQPSVEVIQSQLEDIGIVVTTDFTGSGPVKEAMTAGTYDLAFYSYGVAPSGDPDYYLTAHFDSTAGYKENGWTRYSNATVNSLLASAREEMDLDKRKDYYDQAQAIIVEESPEMFIFHEKELVGYDNKVIGYEIYPNEITFLTKNMYIGR